VVGIDHFVLVAYLRQGIGQVEGREGDGVPAAVAPGQEQQLLHQPVHVAGLRLDGGDRLLQDVLVGLAPAGQHVGVPLNDGDWGAQFVGRVGHEAGLLHVGLVHAGEQVVDCVLQPFEIPVAGAQAHAPGGGGEAVDGVLQRVQLVGGEALARYLLRGAGHLADGLHHPLCAPAPAAPLHQEHEALGGQCQREKLPELRDVRARVRLAVLAFGGGEVIREVVQALPVRPVGADAAERALAPRRKPGRGGRLRLIHKRAHRDRDQHDVHRQHRQKQAP